MKPMLFLPPIAASIALICGGTVPAAATAPASPVAAATSLRATAPVLLINGARLQAAQSSAGGVATAMTPGSGPSSLLTLESGGHLLVIPGYALPYLGRGLDPDLFDVGVLRRAEPGGRLPLRVTFAGRRLRLPGVTVTRSGRGYEDSYLTASGAAAFGAALARQYQGDHARASYGRDGLFGGGTRIALAGRPGTAAETPGPRTGTRPAATMHTLTISAANLQGRPDTGDFVILINEDDPLLLGRTGVEVGIFDHGTAKFSVPTGHYWAKAVFGAGSRSQRLVVLPQFTVHGSTTVHLTERAAISKVGFTTPRAAALRLMGFTVFRGAGNGDLMILGWSGTGITLRVSPTTRRPSVGFLDSQTTAQLTSPAGAPGIPYAYSVAYPGPPGIIPAQHFRVSPASLATIHENYYQHTPSTGSWCTIGGSVLPDGAFDFGCLYFPFRLPATQTQYLSAGPRMAWQTHYGPSLSSLTGGQGDRIWTPRAGQQKTDNWNAYPLHPQPDVQPLHGSLGAEFPAYPAAFRAGNMLTVHTAPFSDNYPGHLGTGFSTGNGAKISGSYAIYQNGTQIAHGSPIDGIEPVRLSAKPSAITFALTASRQGRLFPFSSQTTTTWTWRSAPQHTATVPKTWACGLTQTGYQRHCAVQPMMTLDYHVAGLALNGTTTAGPQTINLSAGHLELAAATRVTGAKAEVSFNGGHTYQAARVTTEGCGHFRVSFTAPAGAGVTLRVSAIDAAGGSISETILGAYQTA